jgi:hypothetical protein
VALESEETDTYVRGSAKLENGTTEILLPQDFSLVTNERGITAQITPTGSVSGMLYVSEKSNTKLVVKASSRKDNAVTFDYIVNGVRRGFENHEPIRDKRVQASK